jgi:hypothetical protein
VKDGFTTSQSPQQGLDGIIASLRAARQQEVGIRIW